MIKLKNVPRLEAEKEVQYSKCDCSQAVGELLEEHRGKPVCSGVGMGSMSATVQFGDLGEVT